MNLSWWIGLVTAADVPPILLWFAVSLWVWMQGKRLYRFVVTIFLLSLAFSIADLVRLRNKWTILGVKPRSSTLLVLGDRLFLFATIYVSTVVIYVVVFRQIRKRHRGDDPYMDDKDNGDDIKLDAAKAQLEQVTKVEESVAVVAREYATIMNRIKKDDPVFLPGIHRMGGFQ